MERIYVARRLDDDAANDIRSLLKQLREQGHDVADVRREAGMWCVYARERRFRAVQPGMLITFHRRAND